MNRGRVRPRPRRRRPPGHRATEYRDPATEYRDPATQRVPVLSAGPVAENVKKVWTAVKDKNKYFHDDIFRGVLLAGNKSAIFKDVDPKDYSAVRNKAYEERMKKMPALDMAVRQALQTAVNTEYVLTIRPAKK